MTLSTFLSVQSEFFERAAGGLTRREYVLGLVAIGEPPPPGWLPLCCCTALPHV